MPDEAEPVNGELSQNHAFLRDALIFVRLYRVNWSKAVTCVMSTRGSVEALERQTVWCEVPLTSKSSTYILKNNIEG